MLRKHYPISVLKKGKNGALIITEDQEFYIPAQVVTTVKDTTGAGDFFAGGFFFGMSRNQPLPVCGRIGALCAAAVIEENGTLLSNDKIEFLKRYINKEVML
jgi:sugar/nucleoside kinase (ribokinase family)